MTKCIPGAEFEVSGPSTTSDRVCQKVSPKCGSNEFEALEPTTSSDRVCSKCDPHCDGCSGVGSRSCSSCKSFKMPDGECVSRCPDSMFPAGPSDSACDCVSGEPYGFDKNGKCRTDINGNGVLDKFAKKCCCKQTCMAKDACGAGAECLVTEGGATELNAQCRGTGKGSFSCDCKESFTLAILKTSPEFATCKACTVCTEAQFTVSECTDTQDTSCQEITTCGADEFVSKAATSNSNAECQKLTSCNPLMEYVAVAPTSTSDRKCEKCHQECGSLRSFSRFLRIKLKVCSGPGPKDCAKCKNMVSADGTCVPECPEGEWPVGRTCAVSLPRAQNRLATPRLLVIRSIRRTILAHVH
jgi:hypothetical protein